MADFSKALKIVLDHEGGYVNDPDDPGGETYRGVARNYNPSWSGWIMIDMLKTRRGFPENLKGSKELQQAIRELYSVKYWHKIRGDKILSQEVAESIFDFAVNAGATISAKLAQTVVKVVVDGVIGPQTLAAVNKMDPELFTARFALAKVARYAYICQKRPASKKYFLGWVNRALEGV